MFPLKKIGGFSGVLTIKYEKYKLLPTKERIRTQKELKHTRFRAYILICLVWIPNFIAFLCQYSDLNLNLKETACSCIVFI